MLLILGLSTVSFGQEFQEVCHVYVVDVKKARQTAEKLSQQPGTPASETGLLPGLTVFPVFYPKIGEEELTLRHYRFPHRRLFFTASIFFTDESEISPDGNSLTMEIQVGRKKYFHSGISGGAITEAAWPIPSQTVRTKLFTWVGRRLYLVGLECQCKESRKAN